MRGAVSMALAYNQVSSMTTIAFFVFLINQIQISSSSTPSICLLLDACNITIYDLISYSLTSLIHGAVYKERSHTFAWERDHDNKYYHCCPFQYCGKFLIVRTDT